MASDRLNRTRKGLGNIRLQIDCSFEERLI